MIDPLDRLDEDGRASLAAVVKMLAGDPGAPSSIRDPEEAWRVHVADSLSGLEFEPLAAANPVADVGAGAGFPGLALAAALPDARVDLIESIERKCEFARLAAERARLANVRVVCERSEDWGRASADGRESYAAATARAVGRLATLAELASPLLFEGGVLVAWKGRRDEDEEAEMGRASAETGMDVEEIRWVGPYAGSRHRHLYLLRKVAPTPARLPRRPGMAKKRPLGAA